jgi:alkanesulfonate monooxygenase SsuD/methylene tetrahydromethanopterin reductase-like flavin-dependent oxidoreductase (luciferase family)
VQWAQRAEQVGFASLGTLDRLVYSNYESLIALAAAAAVTERIELVTDILIAPLRSNTALLAKQAATIDSLSRGRLTLGLAPGGRPDDFEASGVDFRRRARIFEQQLSAWRPDSAPAPRVTIIIRACFRRVSHEDRK